VGHSVYNEKMKEREREREREYKCTNVRNDLLRSVRERQRIRSVK